MGCWNQTCGLSQIHIRAGEKIIIVPLAESVRDSLCYTTPFFVPYPVPFYGEYDDYGDAEDCTGVGYDMMLASIKSVLIEREMGPNTVHDLPITRDDFSIDVFWQSIHQNRLAVEGGYKKNSMQVGVVMIKQSVFDHLAANYVFNPYDYNQGECVYFKYTFNDLLTTVPAIADALLEIQAPSGNEDVDKLNSFRLRHDPIEQAAKRIAKNCAPRSLHEEGQWAATWLKYSNSHLKYGGWAYGILDDKVIELADANDRAGIIEVLTDHLKMLFIDTMLMDTRKFWSPQAGAGSQSDGHDGYRALMAAMDHVLTEEQREYDEYEEGDDEDADEDADEE